MHRIACDQLGIQLGKQQVFLQTSRRQWEFCRVALPLIGKQIWGFLALKFVANFTFKANPCWGYEKNRRRKGWTIFNWSFRVLCQKSNGKYGSGCIRICICVLSVNQTCSLKYSNTQQLFTPKVFMEQKEKSDLLICREQRFRGAN